MDGRQQRSDNVAVIKSRMCEGSVKDGLNQENACQYQNRMHYRTNDGHALLGASSFSPICRPTAGFGASLGSNDPNLLYSDFNYSMVCKFGSSIPRHEDNYNQSHFLRSSENTVLFDSERKSHLSLERLPNVEQKGYGTAQAPMDSALFFQKIRVMYLNFTRKLVGPERRHEEFVNYLHLTMCSKVQMCRCEKFRELISHFDNCHITYCKLCRPVHRLNHTKAIISGPGSERCSVMCFSSESGKPKQHVSGGFARDNIVQDMQPIPKRMKMENADKFDDWSLNSVIRPFLKKREGGLVNDVDYTDKTNKELISSIGPSTTAMTWNAIADDCGSTWSRESNGLLGMGQSPEGHIYSASMDEAPRSIGNLEINLQTSNDALDIDNGRMEKDDAIFHPEEHLLITEQQEMDCMKATQVIGGVTFGCQSSHFDGMHVLPQVDNLGKSLGTCSDALDIDNMDLGKDAAIFHSEEQNMVHEQQGIDYAKTSKAKSDVTFGCQDFCSADISIIPQERDLGKSLGTFIDALNLENINLAKDDDISHSRENRLVDEQQKIDCAKISLKSDVTSSSRSLNSDGISVLPQDAPIDEGENSKRMSQGEHERLDAKYVMPNPDNQCERKLDDLRASGVSLTDSFTADQIREHLHSLNEHVNLELNESMRAHEVGSNDCQLCALKSVTFTDLDMCCTSCEVRIKPKLTYYMTTDGSGVRYYFCRICFKEARGGNISYKGLSFPKAELYKKKNTEESFEAWVQCDRCECWQHQICALYNNLLDTKGNAKYICPFCRLAEIEAKGHASITPVPGAQNLQRTKLSDYLEQRLLGSLQRERKLRAESLGKNPEDVPGASDLTVRVVIAVNKKIKVKQQFLDILHGEAYPTEFPYKSKVIILFQKISGVDVCIFAMYVQEFGSECGFPNKRSVYISYLDSVKYFRPDIKTVSGVPLRTLVYHEILVGYLAYCKQLGFITCYIWACPPSKGEDYILHCHPESQKRPTAQKLVQWYKKMLKKGKEENVVVKISNFYDHFFVPNGNSNCKITAARLPYFDGDYWSRAIEEIAQTIEKDGGKPDRKLKNQMTKRTMKAMGYNDLSAHATKDALVMQKLGHKILPTKEEFIIVHLQFTCTKCHEAILSGSCWSCNQCRKFQLCDRCFKLEQSSHTDNFGDKHQIHEIPVNDVAADTDDKDALLVNDIFDSRHSLLSFCENNFCRFDTLRRAKHSTMMILHLLHASKERATKETICSICNQNVVVGWRCESCSQFHVCNACYQREGGSCHVHDLVKHLKKAESKGRTKEMQQQISNKADKADSRKKSEQVLLDKASTLSTLMDLLEHAQKCPTRKDSHCSYPNCHKMKSTFRHTKKCKLHVVGGCKECKKIWKILFIHSRACKNPNCDIPRCMDIKNHKRKMVKKSDDGKQRGHVT